MIRTIVLAMFLVAAWLVTVRGSSVVNNSGSSSEDSLCVPVMSLDSLGNPASADSFFVVVFKSNANGVIFSDSGTTAMAGLDSVAASGSITYYYYHRAVADIDGVGSTGQYTGIVTAKKNSPVLLTPNRFEFQITSWELDAMGDSAGLAATNSIKSLDSLGQVLDSLQAILDSLQNHDAWVLVPSDTTTRGDSIATQGTDQDVHLKSLTVTNPVGHAVSFSGGSGGGDPINGDGLHIVSLNGDGVEAIGTLSDISGDISGSLASLSSVSANAISATSFQSGAITSLVLATDCITGAELASSAADELEATIWGDTNVAPQGRERLLIDGGSCGEVDTSQIRQMMLNNHFARLTQDTTLQVASDGQAVVDAARISGSAATSDGLEQMMTTSDFQLNLARLTILGANGTDGSFYVHNSTGPGVKFYSTYNGMQGNGLWITSLYAPALYAYNQISGNAVRLMGGGTGAGLWVRGGATGDGVYASGGNTSGNGIRGEATGDTDFYKDLMVSNIDSGAFQGAASGLTAADIWAFEGDRTVNGGYIDSNQTEQGGIAGGDKNVRFYTVDTCNAADTLDGVFITVQNSSGVVKTVLATDASGAAEAVVSDGTWLVIASKNGYCFPDTSYCINGNDTVAVLGYSVASPPP
ncbi:MAG: hypothetical protein OEW00_08300, partial [candidate division Zixibacteria bacterium]|nr:hypothetical protein [candidate division Zixibacteria bacterium]